MLNDLLFRLRSLLRRRGMERELDDELQFHLAHQMEKEIQAGLPPAEAKRRAQIALGVVWTRPRRNAARHVARRRWKPRYRISAMRSAVSGRARHSPP